MVDSPYPDVERLLVSYLAVEVAPAGDQTPPEINGPFIRVQRVGGADDGLTDRARVEIATYALTRADSQQVAEQARQAIAACEGTDVLGTFIDHVVNEAHTGRTPYENEDVRRIASTYRLSVRRPRNEERVSHA